MYVRVAVVTAVPQARAVRQFVTTWIVVTAASSVWTSGHLMLFWVWVFHSVLLLYCSVGFHAFFVFCFFVLLLCSFAFFFFTVSFGALLFL